MGARHRMSTSTFWLVSAPARSGAMFDDLNSQTSRLSQNYALNIPKLRTGTLDSLMALSDDLVKHDSQVDGVVRKLERQMLDFGVTEFSVSVERQQKSTEEFVTNFTWASNKYQEKLSLGEINAKIYQEVMKVDEDLRAKQAEYNSIKTSLQTQARKATGSLAVRNLNALFDKSKLINSENFVTVLAVVPCNEEKQWLAMYETGFLEKEANIGFCPVLLRSSTLLYKDENGENSLYGVIVFRRKLQDFKLAVREKKPRWTIREVDFEESTQNTDAEVLAKLEEQEEGAKKNLISWLKGRYGEVFRAYVHLKVVRVFVESTLRYGVPPDFQIVLMLPNTRYEKQLRSTLHNQFKYLASAALFDGAEEAVPGIAQQEFFPYVFLTMNVTNSVQVK
eukprot:c52699_g1_i1.p1 GENE.c52699_g1_i1~~c52699_g1_i1.p1  ORF type:complete len:393 (-),score=103.18 c52699_g1_i1:146-1324(-)